MRRSALALLLFVLTIFHPSVSDAQVSCMYRNSSPVLVKPSFSFSSGLLLNTNDTARMTSPKRAAVMSAIFPGLGQIYNEKYWKVGIIYVAGFAMSYGLKYNIDSMQRYQRAYRARVDTSSVTTDIWYPNLSDTKVKSERDAYRKNRDKLIMGLAGLYALQIIDASVDAHLKEFDINDDLSVKVTPDFGLIRGNSFRSGLSVRLTF